MSTTANIFTLKLEDKDFQSQLKEAQRFSEQYNSKIANSILRGAELEQKRIKLIEERAALQALGDKKAVASINREIASITSLITAENRRITAIKATNAYLNQQTDIINKKIATEKIATVQQAGSSTAIDKSAKSTENLANQTIRYLRWAGTIAGVLYAAKRAWDVTLGQGLAINKMIESNTFGIAALTSANTRMTDSLGNSLTPYQKFAMGVSVAKDIMKQLRIESTKTPATFAQLTEVYQQATGQTLAMGDAFGTTVKDINENTVQLSKSFTNIAGAIGQPMDRVKEEIRSALTGNVSTDSIISTMIFGSPTEANAAIKKARQTTNGLKDLFDIKFAPFKILEETRSYEKGFLQLQNSWQMTMTDMVEKSEMFKDITDAFYDMSKEINEDSEGMVEKFDSFYDSIKMVGSALDNIIVPATAIASFYAITAAVTMLKKETIALTVAAMRNPFIAGAVVVGTAGYTLSEYLEDESDRLDKISKILKKKKEEILKEDVESLREQKKIIADELNTQRDELLKAEKGDSGILKIFSKSKTNAEQEQHYQTKLKEVTALESQYNKIDETIKLKNKEQEIAEKELATLGKKAELIANVAINEKVSTDIKTFIGKEEEKLVTLQRQKKEWSDDLLVNQKKLAEQTNQDAATQAIINKAIQENKNGIEATDKAIAELRAKENEKRVKEAEESSRDNERRLADEAKLLKIKQDLWVSEQRLLGVEVEKSTVMSFELTALYTRLEATQSISEALKLQTEINNAIVDTEQQVTKEKWEQIKGQKDLNAHVEKYDEYLNRIQETQYENQIRSLDAQIELLNVTQDWNSELSGVASNIMGISKAFSAMSVKEATAQKKQIELEEKLYKDITKKDITQEEMYDLSIQYSKDKEKLDFLNTQNQINGIGQIAGATASMFEEGSDAAKAFQTLQAGMAVISATNAILTQGMGDPYTAFARMAAMAAAVASLMSNAGIEFGTGTTSTSDAFSAQAENTGTGSVLGDAKKQSESIANSLSLLEDLAKPEFALLSQMNNSLISIDRTLGGTAANISRTGGFSLGEGFNASSSASSPLGSLSSIGDFANIMTLGLDSLFGGAIGSFLGSIGSSNTTYSLRDSGINFGAQYIQQAMDEIIGQSFQTILVSTRTSGFFSSSTSNSLRTTFSALDEATSREFSLILTNMYDAVVMAGDGLHLATNSIEQDLSDFIVDIGKISLLNKTAEEIQDQLTAVFGKVGDELAGDAMNGMLDGFQQVGEGLFETLIRVSSGIQEADYYIARLGNGFEQIDFTSVIDKQGDVAFEALAQSIIKADEAAYGLNNGVVKMIESFNSTAEELYSIYRIFEDLRLQIDATNQSANNLTSSMILGAGGTDQLTSGLNDYIDNFLTDAEQFAYHSKALEAEFTKMNLAMPDTVAGFRSIVEGIDTSTSAGQELYGRLIVVSGEFSDVFAGLAEKLQDEINNLLNKELSIQEEIKKMQDEILAAQGKINDAWLGSLSILTEQGKLAYANNMYYEAATSSDRISAAQSAASIAMQTVATKEEYSLYFARLTTSLQQAKAEKTTTDLFEKLEEVRIEISELKDSQRENTINGGLYENNIAI